MSELERVARRIIKPPALRCLECDQPVTCKLPMSPVVTNNGAVAGLAWDADGRDHADTCPVWGGPTGVGVRPDGE